MSRGPWRNRVPLEERFWRYALPEPNSGCWLWIGSIRPDGYGQFSVSAGRARVAHIVAWEMYRGPVPEGLELDHLCRVRSCVNPDHLEPVTHRTNLLRGTGASARNVDKTHCPHGHEYTDDNVYFHRGGRHCRICQKSSSKIQYQAKYRATHRQANIAYQRQYRLKKKGGGDGLLPPL